MVLIFYNFLHALSSIASNYRDGKLQKWLKQYAVKLNLRLNYDSWRLKFVDFKNIFLEIFLMGRERGKVM